jgi:L-seryl-tRNA(Ser) seleniumtransferase
VRTEVKPALPYARGEILAGTEDDLAKLRAAWRIIREREVFNFTGLERSLVVPDTAPELLDDELAPARYAERMTALALDHLGGHRGTHDVFLANRTTAALVAAMQVLVRPGDRVVGVSPSYTHPAAVRAVRLAGGVFEEGGTLEGADLVLLTRIAVTYDALALEEIERVVDSGVPVFVDDAGGARVGPAVLGQPKMLELGVVAGVTGLDKYGTTGPRLGLLGGERELVLQIRARAVELGLEARPMLYPAVVHSLEQYRPQRVRELAATTNRLGEALSARLGDWVERTSLAVRLQGEDILAEATRRAGAASVLAPIEATAALAMVLLRDHGILTVHFAALPPGTSALLFKFVQPETLERFGGAEAFAAAVDASLDELAGLLDAPAKLPLLLGCARSEPVERRGQP